MVAWPETRQTSKVGKRKGELEYGLIKTYFGGHLGLSRRTMQNVDLIDDRKVEVEIGNE